MSRRGWPCWQGWLSHHRRRCPRATDLQVIRYLETLIRWRWRTRWRRRRQTYRNHRQSISRRWRCWNIDFSDRSCSAWASPSGLIWSAPSRRVRIALWGMLWRRCYKSGKSISHRTLAQRRRWKIRTRIEAWQTRCSCRMCKRQGMSCAYKTRGHARRASSLDIWTVR